MTTLAFICFAISKHDCLHDFLPSISNQNQNTPILMERMKSGSKFFTLHSSLFTCHRHYPSNSPLGGLLLLPPPWLSPPSVMSSSPDAAAAACGSTFCQLTSSENWRLNLAATVQPSRLLPLAAFSISAVATFRVPRPSGDGYNAGGYIALWLLALRRCSGERSSESAAIPFGGIAQTSNVSVPFGMGTA